MKKTFHHIGIPTTQKHEGEIHLPAIKLFITDAGAQEHHIEWVRPEPGCPLHPLILQVPHVAYEVDDLAGAVQGRKVLAAPFEALPGVHVAFIEDNGAPVEFLFFKK